MIEIAVLPDGWGDVRPADIRMLLMDTASHLSEPLTCIIHEGPESPPRTM